MSWVTFNSLDSFNAWHEQVKTDLGLPLPALDGAGNEVAGQETTDYTIPHIVSDTDIRADIEQKLTTGLTLSENPYKDDRHEAAPE
jgi:hypothetical protein